MSLDEAATSAEEDTAGERCYTKPWFSVADLPSHCFPTSILTQEERRAIELHGLKLAKHTPGAAEIDKEVRGLAGEYAVSKLLGLNVDTRLTEDGDGGFDFELDGVRLDVKTRSRRINNPDLLVDAATRIRADCYILVQERSRYDYQILGYARADQVFTARSMVIKPSSPAFKMVPSNEVRVIEQDKLYPLTQTLLSEISNSVRRENLSRS